VSPFDRIKSIRASGLAPTDRLVMFVLASYANGEGRCWPSVATIARGSGLTRRGVQKAIRRLEGSDLISKDGDGRGGATAYIVATCEPCSPANEVRPRTGDAANVVRPGGERGSPGGANVVRPKRPIEDSIEETITKTANTALEKEVHITPHQRRTLAAVDIHTPEAAAALTRSEFLNRDKVGPATANAAVVWMAAHGLTFRPEKPKAVKPSAKPWTDIWAEVWMDRRGTKYHFGEWHRASANALGLAESCRGDVETFRRCCSVFHDWIDSDDWKAKPPTVARARHHAPALLNEQPVRRRGEYKPPAVTLTLEEQRELGRIAREKGKANHAMHLARVNAAKGK
tara:strand:- start:1708 stop:2736 length:1029 start_codon:yes stop_codon:yes gene_type:complete